MAASVRIEDEAFSDRRYATLAREAGLADADHARGKMAVLWRQCTLENRHVLPAQDVVDVLGPNAANALIAARLGEVVDGGIRIHGTKGRIEWLKKLRSNGKFGKKGGRPRRNPDGLAEKPMRVSENTKELTPPAPAPAPAPSGSESTYTRAKGSNLENPVLPDGVVGALPMSADWRERKGALVRAISSLHVELFNKVRDEFRLDVPALNPMAGPHIVALQALLETLVDLEAADRDCRHVLAVRDREARDLGHVQYFGALVWKPEQFGRASTTQLKDIGKKTPSPTRHVAAGEPVNYSPRKLT